MMKAVIAARLPALEVITIAVFLLIAPSAGAATQPYFRIYGGDVSVGGWFNNGQASCSNTFSSNYQAPRYNPPALPTETDKGGIFAYAKYDPANNNEGSGAGVDFGVFALGLIEGRTNPSPRKFGFTSGSPMSYQGLSFSNTNDNSLGGNYWGGLFEGNVRQTHCLPDFFAKKFNVSLPQPADIATDPSGQYYINKGSGIQTFAGGGDKEIKHPVDPNDPPKNVAIFIDGNAYIANNITYESGYNASQVTKFALIVRGNIYIGKDVTRLEGLYVAQPREDTVEDDPDDVDDDTSGNIWTCHLDDNNLPTAEFISGCREKLTVDGALLAKQINFVRTNGDVDAAGPNEPANSTNIAEVVHYTPEMVIGQPFFSLPESGDVELDSLISLPPIF